MCRQSAGMTASPLPYAFHFRFQRLDARKLSFKFLWACLGRLVLEVAQVRQQAAFQVVLVGLGAQGREFEDVGAFRSCVASSDCGAGRVRSQVVLA